MVQTISQQIMQQALAEQDMLDDDAPSTPEPRRCCDCGGNVADAVLVECVDPKCSRIMHAKCGPRWHGLPYCELHVNEAIKRDLGTAGAKLLFERYHQMWMRRVG